MACFPPVPIGPDTVYLGPCSSCGNYHGSWQPCINPSLANIILCDKCQSPMTVTKEKITSTTTGGEQDMYFYRCPKCHV